MVRHMEHCLSTEPCFQLVSSGHLCCQTHLSATITLKTFFVFHTVSSMQLVQHVQQCMLVRGMHGTGASAMSIAVHACERDAWHNSQYNVYSSACL